MRGNQIITQMVRLNYIKPNRIISTLKKFLTKGGTVISLRKSNAVIIVDKLILDFFRLISMAASEV